MSAARSADGMFLSSDKLPHLNERREFCLSQIKQIIDKMRWLSRVAAMQEGFLFTSRQFALIAFMFVLASCGKQESAEIPADSVLVKRNDLDSLREDRIALSSLKQSLRECAAAQKVTTECFIAVVNTSGIATVVAKTEDPTPSPVPTPTVEPTPTPVPSSWIYNESVDEMSGKTTKVACVLSDEPVEFDFPYGTQTARLCLRDHPKYGKDVFIAFDKAQFLCGMDGCRVRVKFGAKAPVNFDGVDPADHSSDTLFITPFGQFLKGVRSAETTLIEAQFFQQGERQIRFSTAGLIWK